MNDKLFRTLLKRYEAEIEDAFYKLQCIEDHNMVIPEHVDITGEVDTLLGKIGKAEEKKLLRIQVSLIMYLMVKFV